MIVSKPLNARSPYDRLVDCGKLVRVQIKCIWDTKEKNGRYRMYFKRFGNIHYEDNEVDVFAVYVHPLLSWYILPAKGMKSKTVDDAYLEKWDIFVTQYNQNA